MKHSIDKIIARTYRHIIQDLYEKFNEYDVGLVIECNIPRCPCVKIINHIKHADELERDRIRKILYGYTR